MALKLMKGSLQYKNQIIEMIKEWKSYNDTHDANTSPWAIFKNDYDDFEYYLNTKMDGISLAANDPITIEWREQYKFLLKMNIFYQ